jgi:structure-specific recognition protein 1
MGVHCDLLGILWVVKSVVVFEDAGESVVVFEDVVVLTPRGRYTVELHLSFLRLQGQANDFKIQYSSVVCLFLLPRSNQPHTFVVISLDPPIHTGQTLSTYCLAVCYRRISRA